MNFTQLYLRVFATKAKYIETPSESLRIDFPDYFWIKKRKESIQIHDFEDKYFFLEFSFLTNSKIRNVDIENEFEKINIQNPNAQLQNIGKYDCICNATVTEDGRFISYQWSIIHQNKIVLATFATNGKDLRELIDQRIDKVYSILKGIEIKD